MNLKEIPSKVIPIDKIVFDENNPNRMSAQQVEALNKVVDRYGFAQDPWVNEKKNGEYMVIDGEHRVKLLKERGVKSIKCKVFKIKYADVRMLRQVANKLRGSHDKDADFEEYKKIYEDGNLEEFAKLIAVEEEAFEAILEKKGDYSFGGNDVVPDVPKKPISKTGQLYELGEHRILCGDSANAEDLKLLLGDNKIGLIFTDPPYGVSYSQGKYTGKIPDNKMQDLQNDDLNVDDHRKWMTKLFEGVMPYCKATPFYVFAAALENAYTTLYGLMDSGFHVQSQIIWVKQHFALGRNDYHWKHEGIWYGYSGNPHTWNGGRDQSSIWEIDKDDHNSYVHPTQKPIALANKAIFNSSRKGEIVFDPFLGSGSTLMAAEENGRKCYGIEIEPAFIDVIIKRWESHTGKKAKLVK